MDTHKHEGEDAELHSLIDAVEQLAFMNKQTTRCLQQLSSTLLDLASPLQDQDIEPMENVEW